MHTWGFPFSNFWKCSSTCNRLSFRYLSKKYTEYKKKVHSTTTLLCSAWSIERPLFLLIKTVFFTKDHFLKMEQSYHDRKSWGPFRALGNKKGLFAICKKPLCKKKVLKIFWACCIVLTLQGGGVKEGVKGEKTKVCHVET